MPNFKAEKNVYSLAQNVVVVYIAHFALRDNCEGTQFFVLLIRLNYTKP